MDRWKLHKSLLQQTLGLRLQILGIRLRVLGLRLQVLGRRNEIEREVPEGFYDVVTGRKIA
jgi:hypothetical protein